MGLGVTVDGAKAAEEDETMTTEKKKIDAFALNAIGMLPGGRDGRTPRRGGAWLKPSCPAGHLSRKAQRAAASKSGPRGGGPGRRIVNLPNLKKGS